MRMFASCINLKVADYLASQAIVGQHACDCPSERISRVPLKQCVKRIFLEPTDETCIVAVLHVRRLVAGNLNLVGIDDYYKVSTQNVWFIRRLVLAAKNTGSLCSHTTQVLS